jgi:hypothetical protein
MKNFAVILIFVFIGTVSVEIMAQSPTPSATPAILQNAIGAINNVSNKIPVSVPPSILVVLSFLVSELVAHGIPTSKPVSWFFVIEAVLGAVSAFLTAIVGLISKLQNLCTTLGSSLNNVK